MQMDKTGFPRGILWVDVRPSVTASVRSRRAANQFYSLEVYRFVSLAILANRLALRFEPVPAAPSGPVFE